MIKNRIKSHQFRAAWLMLLTVSALGLRLTLLPTRLLAENDGPYYIALAAQLLRGEWSGALNDYWSQLYPVAIAFVGIFIRGLELASRLVSTLCGAALVPATWWLVNEVADPLSAHVAALLILFQPWLLVFSVLPLTEMLFALLMIVALASIVRAGRSGGLRRFVLAGGLTGLTILTRSEGLLLIGALLGAGVMRLARHGGWPAVRESLTGFAALVLVLAPQSIGTYRMYGHFNFIWKSSVNVVLGETFNDPRRAEQAVYSLDDQGQRQLNVQARQISLGEYWVKYSNIAVQRIGDNARVIWRDHMTTVLSPIPGQAANLILWMGALAGLGMMTGLAGTNRGVWLGLLGFVAAYSLGLLSVLVHPRLLVPLTPFSLIFIARGCVAVGQAAQLVAVRILRPDSQRVGYYVAGFLGGMVLLWAAASSYTWAHARHDPFSAEHPLAEKEAGEWLRANAPQTAKILSHNPQTPFYFYDTWPFDRAIALPWAAPDEVLAYAREQNVNYIVLEEWIIDAAHFPVEPWLDTTRPHPGLKLLKVFGAAPYRIIIYRRV